MISCDLSVKKCDRRQGKDEKVEVRSRSEHEMGIEGSKKLKQSHYSPGEVQRVPGSYGSQIS